MEKRRNRIEGQKKANLRKFKTYGLASALLGAGVLATVVGPDALANNTVASSTNQTTVHYRYATLDELSSTEKQSLVKALPKSVTEEATYYLVYRSSTLPKTNSIASPLAVLLGLGTLVIAVKVGKSGRKTAIYMATLTAVAGLATASTVYAVSTNVLGKYNRDLTLTVGSELPDGKLTLSGYEFVGYLPGVTAAVTTTTSTASTIQATTTTSAPATTVATTEVVTTKVATTVAPTTVPSAPVTSSSTTTVTTEAPSTTVTSATTEAPSTTVTSATTEAPTTTVTSATTESTSSTTSESSTTTTKSTTTSTTTQTTTKATTTITQATTSATIATATPKMGISLGTNPSSPVKEYTVTLNQATVKSEAMTYLKQLRLDMYNNINPKFNGTDLRSYLSSIGITSAEQYASSFTWDETLERIAIQRALETGIHREFAHKRTNSSGINTATDITTGKGFYGEIIQWGYGMKDALTQKTDYSFAYGELDDLNANNGNPNSANAHLYILLDPTNKSYGFASITDSNFWYNTVTLGVYRKDVSDNTSGGTANGTYTLNYAID